MPILATGFLTLLLVFYSGYALRGQNCTSVSDMVASSFLYSMLISWLIFLCAYFLDLSAISLSALIVIVTGISFWYGNHGKLVPTNVPGNKNLSISVLILLFAGGVLYFTYLYTQEFYTPVFIFWDAVASYNRWAIELVEGKYTVGGAAYPVLYPGLWSLVYRLQDDTTFWIISKTTLLAAPITLFIYSVSLSLERRSLFPMLFIIGCGGLVIFRTPYFLSGMMDIAVVILGMLSCLLLWKENTEDNPGSLSLLSAGVASLIKQAGLAFLLLAVLMKLTNNWRPKAFIRGHWKPVVLALSLPLSFLAFFLLYNDFQQIPGSFRSLQKVAENAANGSNLIPHALSLAYSYLPLKIILPLTALLLTGIYLSTPKLRWLSIFSLVTAAIGFIIWMFFTSYDIRNFYWSIILVIFAATIGLDALITRITALIFRNKSTSADTNTAGYKSHTHRITWIKPLIIALPLLALLPIITTGEAQLKEYNDISRDEVIPPTLRPMFERPPPGLTPDFGVLTNVQPLLWSPKLEGRIEIELFRGAYKRVRDRLKNSNASVLLVKKLPDGGGYPNVRRLKQEQLIKQVVDSKLYTIYMIQR